MKQCGWSRTGWVLKKVEVFDGSDSFSVVLRIFLLGEESYSEVVVGVRKTFGILHLLRKFENECLVS